MKKLILGSLIALWLLPHLCPVALPSAHAAPPPAASTAQETPAAVAARVQQHYDHMNSLSFTFHQQTSGEMTGRPRTGEGSALFLRTGTTQKMRWEYTRPDEQLIISDGAEIKLYFKELQQLIVAPAASMAAELTWSFFTGGGNLVRDFSITEAEAEFVPPQEEDPDGTQWIKLTPNSPQQQVQDIHILVTADGLIQRLAIRDHFGTMTTMVLSNIAENPLSGSSDMQLEALFSFTPPAGTEIIEQESLH